MAQKKPGRIQSRVNRLMARIPWLRRRYVKYILRYIEKSRKKGRDLPPELEQVDKQLRKVPPSKRYEVMEQLVAMNDPAAAASRQMRRAMDRQNRQRSSGKGQRPGTMGGSRVVERR